jgi:conjugative transfer signal peptidase TraF
VFGLRIDHRLSRTLGIAALGLLAALALAVALGLCCRRLTYNTTPSLPRGLYTLRPERPPVRGDVVVFSIPASLAPLVATRRYLPLSFRLLKRLVAVPGDHVCLDGVHFVVNGRVISDVARVDSLGRPLPDPYRYCGVVAPGLGFVATPPTTSLDSRFFGPLDLDQLIPAEPTWIPSSR